MDKDKLVERFDYVSLRRIAQLTRLDAERAAALRSHAQPK